jgi:TolB-like protein/Flp pilus assembly protein TadD
MSFFDELKRRKVYRVPALYIVVSWLVLQVADLFMGFLPLPDWTPTLIFVLLLLGFPVALVLAWAFQVTPEGLRLEDRSGAPGAEGAVGPGRPWFGAAAAAVVLAVAGYAWYARDGGVGAEPAESGSGFDAIVVLPLEDLTNDPDQAYFVSGMHDALITELSKIEALSVISRISAMAYQNSSKSIPQIARELGVDAVVTGSVLRAGGTVRVTANLIEASTDRHLWAENYDREVTDILALYGEVAREIVTQIRVEVTPGEVSRLGASRSVDPAAYERYLQARFLCDNWSPQDLRQGVDLMREASRLDPDYASAQAELALCLQYSAFFNYVDPLEIYEESRTAAEKALELDEGLAEAHVAMAGVRYYLEFDQGAATAELERALELNPGSVKALIHTSWLLGESGRFEDALPPTLKAIELDPLNTSANHALGQLYLLARDFDRAIEAFDKALALDRGDPALVAWPAWAYAETGALDLALEASRAAVELSDRAPLYVSQLAFILARMGRLDEVEPLREELRQNDLTAASDLAIVHIGLGEYQEAIDQLELAYEQRNGGFVYIRHAAVYDPLRDLPRFQQLLDRFDH